MFVSANEWQTIKQFVLNLNVVERDHKVDLMAIFNFLFTYCVDKSTKYEVAIFLMI